MAEMKTIDLDDLDFAIGSLIDGSLPAAGSYALDANYPPVVVSWTPETQCYDLIDGYHRLTAALAEGREKIEAIVVNDDEIARHRDLGDNPNGMPEAEWIDWIQELADQLA